MLAFPRVVCVPSFLLKKHFRFRFILKYSPLWLPLSNIFGIDYSIDGWLSGELVRHPPYCRGQMGSSPVRVTLVRMSGWMDILSISPPKNLIHFHLEFFTIPNRFCRWQIISQLSLFIWLGLVIKKQRNNGYVICHERDWCCRRQPSWNWFSYDLVIVFQSKSSCF